MKTILSLLICSALISRLSAQVATPSKPEFIEVHSDEGTLNAVARRFTIQCSNAKEPYTVAGESLFLPEKKLLWVGSFGNYDYRYFFLWGNKIVGLLPLAGGNVWVCSSTTNLSSSADITNSVNEHISKHIQKLSENPHRNNHDLNLRVIFGPQPFLSMSTWPKSPVPTIEGVTFDKTNAVLHFDILGGKFTVTVNENFQVVGASKDNQPIALPKKVPLD